MCLAYVAPSIETFRVIKKKKLPCSFIDLRTYYIKNRVVIHIFHSLRLLAIEASERIVVEQSFSQSSGSCQLLVKQLSDSCWAIVR